MIPRKDAAPVDSESARNRGGSHTATPTREKGGYGVTTIKDIAKAIGVAHSTVSRALNGDPRISAATREKVLRAAQELNYRPNLSAKGLARRRVLSVGLVVPDVSEPFYGRIVAGVDRVTYDAGFNLVLYLTHADRERELAALEQIRQGRVDGLILMIRKAKAEAVIEMQREGVPLVLLLQEIPGSGIGSVRVDNAGGAIKAVRHLAAGGHRRIAMIVGPSHAPDSRERRRGYRQALKEEGIPFEPEMIARGDYSFKSGYRAVDKLMSLPASRRPTAIFAANDHMAMGAIKRLTEIGVSVPGDVAVIGFDDIAPAAYYRPALTTVRQPIEESARRAAELLIGRIQGTVSELPEVELGTELVVRESCGQPGLHVGGVKTP